MCGACRTTSGWSLLYLLSWLLRQILSFLSGLCTKYTSRERNSCTGLTDKNTTASTTTLGFVCCSGNCYSFLSFSVFSGALLPAEKLTLPTSHLCETGRAVTPVTFVTSITSRRGTFDVLAPSHGHKNRAVLTNSQVELPLSLWHCQIKLSITGEQLTL
jgi:hypothetical protein